MKKIDIDIESMDFGRLEEKAARLAMGYRSGKSALIGGLLDGKQAMVYGTAVHSIMIDDYSRKHFTPEPKAKKPWKKGFIPTVGKKPELPAPDLGTPWKLESRDGNKIYYTNGLSTPFTYGPRIVGDLLARKWYVEVPVTDAVVHDELVVRDRIVFRSTRPEACVVFVALDPDLQPKDRSSPFSPFDEAKVRASMLTGRIGTWPNKV